MLKESHTISYIQQVSHEWIEGDEEIVYVQVTESLRVVPIDIQKVLPLVKGTKGFTQVQSSPQALGQSFV